MDKSVPIVTSALAAALPNFSHVQIMDVNDGRVDNPPEMCEGYLMKKKKWPRKGWHKRYFRLEAGLLCYAKTPNAIKKGKLHGRMDVGLCVMSHKKTAMTIDLDAEDTIFHIKAKNINLFQQWLVALRLHREYHNKNKDTTLTNHTLVPSPIHMQAETDGLMMGTSAIGENSTENSASTVKQDLTRAHEAIEKLSQLVSEMRASASSTSLRHVISSSHSFNHHHHQVTPSSPMSTTSKKERKQSKKKKSSIASSSSSSHHKSHEPSSSTCGAVVPGSLARPHSSTTSVPSAAASHHDSATIKPPGGALDHNMSYSNPDLTLLAAAGSGQCKHGGSSGGGGDSIKSNQTTPTRPAVLSLSSNVLAPSSSGDGRSGSVVNGGGDVHATFVNHASDVYRLLASIYANCEQRERAVQQQQQQLHKHNGDKSSSISKQLAAENQLLRARLERIHAESEPLSVASPDQLGGLQTSSSEKTVVKQSTLRRMPASQGGGGGQVRNPVISQMSSESQLSINDTISDMFYDAEEYLLSGGESSSSESEAEEGSETNDDVSTDDVSEPEDSECVSAPDVSDTMMDHHRMGESKGSTGRRQRLPSQGPHSSGGVLSMLKKNIGRDLSKVSMPVTMNEPLNALQHLCEELEYSDLLDKAAACDDKYDRMVLVAAFAVSAYGATYHRAGQKPFNPILGETYECIREDRGFKFVAEQVSHHPPVSACHCDGENFEFWQDTHFKNTFWGRSLEIVPIGKVNVRLKTHETIYQWKKVTSCVHNIIAGNRWIEHYGDMHITGGDVSCKLNFMKGSYFSSKKGDFKGVVTNSSGEVMRQLHGRWFEGLFCGHGSKSQCIWRTGAMPPDFEKYYGFTRFAIELNEMEPGHEKLLPRTDTRFRPDQRLLEEGDVEGATSEKQRVEDLQRERRKHRETNNIDYKPTFFCKVKNGEEESWVFKGDYWKMRNSGGFQTSDKIPKLW